MVKNFIRKLNKSWGEINEEATIEEKNMLNDIITPYFKKNEETIYNLCKIEDNIMLQCKAFHGESLFRRETPLSLVEKYRSFVSTQYKPPVSYIN